MLNFTGFPPEANRVRIASNEFVDADQHVLSGIDLILALNAVQPGGIFAAPFIPSSGFGTVNATEVFDNIVCELYLASGKCLFLRGLTYTTSHSVSWRDPVQSTRCRVNSAVESTVPSLVEL